MKPLVSMALVSVLSLCVPAAQTCAAPRTAGAVQAAAAGAGAGGRVPGFAIGAKPGPADTPVVIEQDTEIIVLFPGNLGVAFDRIPGMGPAQFQGLQVDDEMLLASVPNSPMPPPVLEWIGPGSVGGVQDWPAYLLLRLTLGEWPQLGMRASGETSLD